jgi:hypothetical protein
VIRGASSASPAAITRIACREFGRSGVLEEEAARAGLERVEDVRVGVVCHQDQDPDVFQAMRSDDLAGGLDPVELRHLDVHEYDVGPGGPGPLHGLGPVRGLSHHGDVVLGVEQHLEAGSHQDLIVGEQHGDWSRGRTTARPPRSHGHRFD